MKIIIAIIIILLVLFISVERFIMIPPTLITIPAEDKRCQDKYNNTNAFFDPTEGKCYTCDGIPRNAGVSITNQRGCRGVATSPATIVKADNKPAKIERDGVIVGGLNNCKSGWITGPQNCLRCESGYNRLKLRPNFCRKCQPAQSENVERCAPKFSNKTSIIGSKKVECGVAFRGRDRSGNMNCWCCPPKYVRTIQGVTTDRACRIPNTRNFSRATKLVRSNNNGFPLTPSGWTLANGKIWKCPSGTTKNTIAWGGDNTCCDVKPIEKEPRKTCAQSYPATASREQGIFHVVAGKCFTCPKGYNNNILEGINSQDKCVKNLPGYNRFPGGFWKCPDNYSASVTGVFLPPSNDNKCVRRGSRIQAGKLLGK